MRGFATVLCSFVLLAHWGAVKANGQVREAEAHVATAKAAAYEPGQDFTLILDLCAPPKAGSAASRPFPRPAEAPPVEPGLERRIPPRAKWFTEPVRAFDNVYYVGGSRDDNMNVWAVTTADGIILLDAGWDYTVEELVVNGLKKLGLDPAKIKYVILTEAKPEIYGGAKFLQDRYNAHV